MPLRLVMTLLDHSTNLQVAGYGRYLQLKFKLSEGDFPNDEVREYLGRNGKSF